MFITAGLLYQFVTEGHPIVTLVVAFAFTFVGFPYTSICMMLAVDKVDHFNRDGRNVEGTVDGLLIVMSGITSALGIFICDPNGPVGNRNICLYIFGGTVELSILRLLTTNIM